MHVIVANNSFVADGQYNKPSNKIVPIYMMTEFKFQMFIVMNRCFGRSYIKSITMHTIGMNNVLILKVKSNFEHLCRSVAIINEHLSIAEYLTCLFDYLDV